MTPRCTCLRGPGNARHCAVHGPKGEWHPRDYVRRDPDEAYPDAIAPTMLCIALRSLLHAVQPVLAAHRSTEAHVTEEQITQAWTMYDHGRDVLKRATGEKP